MDLKQSQLINLRLRTGQEGLIGGRGDRWGPMTESSNIGWAPVQWLLCMWFSCLQNSTVNRIHYCRHTCT